MVIEKTGHLVVTVAALTRQRPKMLAALIKSWSNLSLPPNCDVTFLVVENNQVESARDYVENFANRFEPGKLQYVCETEPGIPFARNRAASEAIAAKNDLLIFVDDDEVVAADWLEKFLAGYRGSPALLLGAPLRMAAPLLEQSFWRKRMNNSMQRRYVRKERKAKNRASLQDTRGVTVVTNNWLCHLSVFSDHGMWFDEKMRFTGGTDAKFYAQCRAKGVPTGWVEDAYVYETIPPERLSFVYQYRRGRDQSNTNFRRKIARSPHARWRVLVTIPYMLLAIIVLTTALPFTNGGTVYDLSRALGRLSGQLKALIGGNSELYTETTGF